MTLSELLKQMEEKAGKATSGIWQVDGTGTIVCDVSWPHKHTVIAPMKAREGKPIHDAEYIATANPANILALIEYVKVLEGALEGIKTEVGTSTLAHKIAREALANRERKIE